MSHLSGTRSRELAPLVRNSRGLRKKSEYRLKMKNVWLPCRMIISRREPHRLTTEITTAISQWDAVESPSQENVYFDRAVFQRFCGYLVGGGPRFCGLLAVMCLFMLLSRNIGWRTTIQFSRNGFASMAKGSRIVDFLNGSGVYQWAAWAMIQWDPRENPKCVSATQPIFCLIDSDSNNKVTCLRNETELTLNSPTCVISLIWRGELLYHRKE